MRTKIVAGNWKMNTTLADAHTLAVGIRDGVEHIERIETVLCPPTIWLSLLAHDVVHLGQYPHLKLGAQNMYFEDKGTFTGETSPLMVKEVAEYVILGHSERVNIFKEDPELISHKLGAALNHGLKPILCVGELEQSATSKKDVVEKVKRLLDGVSQEGIEKTIIAYEPIWAISAGASDRAATPEYAQEMLGELRELVGQNTRLMYGGSANDENTRGFLTQPDIDGLLVGGASVKLQMFLTMLQIADDIAGEMGHSSLHN